jgi:predicted lipoprotein
MTFLKSKKLVTVLLCTVFVCLYACSKKGETPDPTPQTDAKAANRKLMLVNIADNIVIPSYGKFKTKLDVMTAKSNAFTAAPATNTLTEFRAAWVDAYIEWQKVELFDFGPGQTEAIRSYFNIYPASETGIAANINTGATANLDVAGAFPTQGFPALDYLLNGLGANDAAILAFYTTAGDATKRIDYVKRLTQRMNTIFTKVNTDWATYRTQFVDRTGIDASSSTSVMTNSYILNFERYIRSGKFGIPSGAMLNGVVAANKVEAYYKKDISLSLAKAATQATIDFFNGKGATSGIEGASLKTYLTSLGNPALVQTINTQFTAINAKLTPLPENLYNQVNTNNQSMIDVYTEMQKAVRMLKVDMTSAISITISYTDNDGD